VRKKQFSEIFKLNSKCTINERAGMNLGKRIFYLIFQIVIIIGLFIFAYYFVWDEQLGKSIIWAVMIVVVTLLTYYTIGKFIRDNKDE
jgi:Na+/melibiose symporter-like transporter